MAISSDIVDSYSTEHFKGFFTGKALEKKALLGIEKHSCSNHSFGKRFKLHRCRREVI